MTGTTTMPAGAAAKKTHHHVPNAAPSPKTARYSHCVEAGGWLYVTGQLPVDPDDPEAPLPATIQEQTELSFRNLERILAHAGYRFADTVFARIFLSDFDADYPGLNEVFHRYYADNATMPSRTTVGVAKLGRGAKVEIDLVCYKGA
jgi:reactive intermediate/imine deaminase